MKSWGWGKVKTCARKLSIACNFRVLWSPESPTDQNSHLKVFGKNRLKKKKKKVANKKMKHLTVFRFQSIEEGFF